MLNLISQTNLDTIFFIGNDETHTKVAALNLGLLKKGYRCEGTGSTQSTFMLDPKTNQNCDGLRVRFTKSETEGGYKYSNHRYQTSNRHYFKRKLTDLILNTTPSILTISRGLNHYKTEIQIKVFPNKTDSALLIDNNILERYSRHIRMNEAMAILPELTCSLDVVNTDFSPTTEEEIEQSKQHLDTAVARVKTFEENYQNLYPLLMMKNISEKIPSRNHEMSLAEFDKFSRLSEIINKVTIPTYAAKKRFIELCEIFKNNNVLSKFKGNNFEFIKDYKSLTIKFCGISLFNDMNISHFQYFDHPGVNFCADFLDKTRTFDIIEAKITKEIITRI